MTPGERVILQAARLTSWKGQSVLIEAAARLEAAGRLGNAVVVLAGDAQGRNTYAAGVASPGCSGLASKAGSASSAMSRTSPPPALPPM